MLPQVARIQRDGAALRSSVGLQLHLDAGGTDAVRIVGVVPGLLNRHGHLSGGLAVGQGGDRAFGRRACRSGGVGQAVAFGQSFFLPGIDDLRSGVGSVGRRVLPLRQASDRLERPVVVLREGHGLGGLEHSVGLQSDGQRIGTVAVLIACIVPDLSHRHVDLFRRVRIGDLKPRGHASGDGLRVEVGHCDLVHSIDDGNAVFLLGKTRPGMLPAVGRSQRDGAALCNIVCIELHLDGGGADAVFIAGVAPGLGDRHLDHVGQVRVGQSGDRAVHGGIGQRVAGRQIFFTPGVGDRGAVRKHRQLIDGPGPLVSAVQRNALAGRLPVGEEVDDQACGPDTILVLTVVPNLHHGRLGSRNEGVGDDIGFLILLIRIGDGGDHQGAFRRFGYDNRNGDRSGGSPHIAGICFGDRIVVGTCILEENSLKRAGSFVVEGHRSVRGHRSNDRNSAHIVAGGIGSGRDVEGEILVACLGVFGVFQCFFHIKICFHAHGLDVDLIGIDIDIHMPAALIQGVGKMVDVAGDLVVSVRVEGRGVGGGRRVQNLSLHGEGNAEVLAGADHLAVVLFKGLRKGHREVVSVLCDGVIRFVGQRIGLRDGVHHIVRIGDGDGQVGRAVRICKGHTEFGASSVVDIGKLVGEYDVADRIPGRLVGRFCGKGVGENFLLVNRHGRGGGIDVIPDGLALGEHHTVVAEGIRGPGGSHRVAQPCNVGIAVVGLGAVLRGVDPVDQLEGFFVVDRAVDGRIVVRINHNRELVGIRIIGHARSREIR